MSLLPSRLEVSASPDEPRVLDIDGEDAADAFDVLGSETARRVLSTIYDAPRTPTEVRDAVGTSLQNVHYHLERLEGAGLIEPAGVGYSEKGNEMTVYAPASEAVVLFAGADSDGNRLRDLLGRVFAMALVVGVSTLCFAAMYEWLTPDPSGGAAGDGPGAMSTESAEAADATAATLTAYDPILAFFLGGCVVVAAVTLWWVLRPRLRSRASSR